MNDTAFLLGLLGYGVMYALPHVFFRRDQRSFNLMWWLVAAPFSAAPAALVLNYLGVLSPLVSASSTAGHVLGLVGVPLLVASIALVAATVAAHRVPLALWHQDDDAPRSIVTHGPYRLVRHPFYVAFVLLLSGSVAISPDLVTVASLPVGVLALWLTARREEERLAASQFGAEYRAYQARTGRFVPRLFGGGAGDAGTGAPHAVS